MRPPSSFPSPKQLAKELQQLHQQRKAGKQTRSRTRRLTKQQRLEVLSKTNGKCHICGTPLTADQFQADHVQAHVSGGSSLVDNFLPSCSTCNNYRWHYLPEEIQWILKFGVWAKTQIEKETVLGRQMAEGFVKAEIRRVKSKK